MCRTAGVQVATEYMLHLQRSCASCHAAHTKHRLCHIGRTTWSTHMLFRGVQTSSRWEYKLRSKKFIETYKNGSSFEDFNVRDATVQMVRNLDTWFNRYSILKPDTLKKHEHTNHPSPPVRRNPPKLSGGDKRHTWATTFIPINDFDNPDGCHL